VKAQGAEAGGFLTLLRDAEFLKILALGFVTYGPITTITGLWGGPYLQDVAGFSADGAGAVLLVLFCASIFGAAAFGQMDRHFASRKRVILGAVLASSVSMAVLAGVPGLPVSLVIGLLLIAVFAQQFFIALRAYAACGTGCDAGARLDVAGACICCCNPVDADRVWRCAGFRCARGVRCRCTVPHGVRVPRGNDICVRAGLWDGAECG
jgi:predicted MFS family arabinose efflux permease